MRKTNENNKQGNSQKNKDCSGKGGCGSKSTKNCK